MTRRLNSHLPLRLLLSAAALILLAGAGTKARAQFDQTQMTNDYLRMQNQVITNAVRKNAARSRRTNRARRVVKSRPAARAAVRKTKKARRG